MFTKTQLLKTAKANGFKGTDEQAADWIKKNLDIRDADGNAVDVDSVFARKTVTVTADAGEDVQVVGSTPAEGEMETESAAKSISDDEAIAEHRRVLSIVRATVGPSSGMAAMTLANLAELDALQGRHELALSGYEQALAITRARSTSRFSAGAPAGV